MRKFVLAIAALALLSVPAAAMHCPKDMAAIDEAMKTAQLDDKQKAEVMKYREEGEAYHKAGKHQESVDTLKKAMDILGISN